MTTSPSSTSSVAAMYSEMSAVSLQSWLAVASYITSPVEVLKHNVKRPAVTVFPVKPEKKRPESESRLTVKSDVPCGENVMPFPIDKTVVPDLEAVNTS